ncbi:hypothetical protein I302_101258 [Kwoniella bestiolae CBS 10118]|uniref:Uncharacterized protein n=1 Tax=Kwoniella bestiolae CBS 10118 TaxID=1296100 RepID=A0A1B9G7G5_9TREE|nr:hypothetical protein I302_04632 [Kwoniella bestiolae CBS 10118]OCF26941.1 hypothetical protein I302_04632 [Kwoniella bestiolae CBS 10118]
MGTIDGSNYQGEYDTHRSQASHDPQWNYGVPEISLLHYCRSFTFLVDVSADPSSEPAAFLSVPQRDMCTVKLRYPDGQDEDTFDHPAWEKARVFWEHLDTILGEKDYNLPFEKPLQVPMDLTLGRDVPTILIQRVDDHSSAALTALSQWAEAERANQGLTEADVTFKPVDDPTEFHRTCPVSVFAEDFGPASWEDYLKYLDSLAGHTLGDVRGTMPIATVSGEEIWPVYRNVRGLVLSQISQWVRRRLGYNPLGGY